MSIHNALTRYVKSCLNVGIQESTKVLVCQAMYQKIYFNHRKDNISLDNISLFLNIANLILMTGKDGHESLCNILQLLMKYFPICDETWLPLPHTTKLLQTHILNRCNQNSLISLLPIPSFVENVIDGHAYCPLKELIAYITFFNGGQNTSKIKSTHYKMLYCKHVSEYLDQVKCVIEPTTINVLCMTFFWMDGYDPNTSSKGNRKGAWAATRTVILYDLIEQQIYFVGTYLFAVGPGKGMENEDHTSIFKEMKKDNQDLTSPLGFPKPINMISSYHKYKTIDIYIYVI